MGKIYGLHTLELKAGVDEAEFESFAADSISQLPPLSGWGVRLLKGDRGERVGDYVWLVEIDSIEDRDRLSPQGGMESTAEAREWVSAAESLFARWRPYVEYLPGDGTYTDYREIVGYKSAS